MYIKATDTINKKGLGASYIVSYRVASELYVLQLDESTDVAGLTQLLVYVCYVYWGSIKEDILFVKFWTAL